MNVLASGLPLQEGRPQRHQRPNNGQEGNNDSALSAILASLAILVVSGRQWAYIPLFVCGLAALSYGQNVRSEVLETLSEKALYHHDMRLPPD